MNDIDVQCKHAFTLSFKSSLVTEVQSCYIFYLFHHGKSDLRAYKDNEVADATRVQ